MPILLSPSFSPFAPGSVPFALCPKLQALCPYYWVFWGLKFEPDAEIGQKVGFCKGLAQFRMLETKAIIRSVAGIVKKEVDVEYRLFLFGSRAENAHHPKADIDIGILSDKSIDPIRLSNIREEIDRIPTLLKIDFVDFSSVSQEFKQIAMEKTKNITLIDRSK